MGGLRQVRVGSVDVGGHDMAPLTPHARIAPGYPWRSSTTRASLIVVAGAAPLPRPDRLLEVGDTGWTAVDDDLAQLIDDGGRRRVHE